MTAARFKTFFFLILLVVLLFPLAAQDSEDEGDDGDEDEGGGVQLPIDSDWPDTIPEVYSRGDKIFGISLGALFPLFFVGESGILSNNVNIGGTLALSYNYFFNSHLFFGGELGGMFASTKGENVMFIVPMGLRIGYQFILGHFEAPFALMVGIAPQKYLEEGYFGFFAKPSASLFWRFNSDWSFGLNTAWWWVPQWADRSVYGNFVELTLSARYHF
ncbi:TP0733 family outer membrane beta-barrel protein [Treponema primitia]|uniref:TP0733 family outer membrane beta-barrel protein n=1 Tax=Treponema primitia TaxID=88058 RepID=UPI00025556B9|nr:hypothetical protein [Treponema primitia]